ncbi:MAG: flippase-like domain-containing protein [Gammaproteobacteria bacterium]|jgi:glycosyltransferase 2 family protein|nr:flippase-like domain-containing protein [Gammaproteobacteria bacterium]MBT4654874.1 flippase-like domain-containing protein [Gammaproteobacteria bacterium]MBT5761747.1 flippase-like domain-containing protein [Gammaproteobacteria bacterium]MBT6331265.1 flippase-like domain-containing protein [Gammaproteobacteria bacterium]MBT7322571.1 flippase-like domain-containing protein [Gammaproteobacteria bacterium]
MSIRDALKYLASIIVIYYIINEFGINISNILSIIDPRYILLIVLVSIFQHILSAYRWMYISKVTNLNISFSHSIQFYYISTFMNNILPGGIMGDIFRIYYTSEKKNEILKMGKSMQSVIFERLSGQIMLLAFFVVSLTIYFLINQKYEAFLYLFFPSISIFILFKYFLNQKIKKILGKKQISQNLYMVFTGEIFWRHLTLSFFVVCSYILIYIISAVSLGLNIDYLSFLVFSPIILFSMTLPISVGGWGIRELTALLLSLLLGLSASASISVSIIYGILNLLCSLPGLYFFMKIKLN